MRYFFMMNAVLIVFNIVSLIGTSLKLLKKKPGFVWCPLRIRESLDIQHIPNFHEVLESAVFQRYFTGVYVLYNKHLFQMWVQK